MLNLRKKYYVCAEGRPCSVLEAWANENTMKLIESESFFYGRTLVFELNVQYNDDLKLAIGMGHFKLMNGKRQIGRARFIQEAQKVIIRPEIRDR